MLRRVKKLEADGVITGYRAIVSQEALDRGFQVIVTAEIGVNDQATIEQFESRVAAFDEVIECRSCSASPTTSSGWRSATRDVRGLHGHQAQRAPGGIAGHLVDHDEDDQERRLSQRCAATSR